MKHSANFMGCILFFILWRLWISKTAVLKIAIDGRCMILKEVFGMWNKMLNFKYQKW